MAEANRRETDHEVILRVMRENGVTCEEIPDETPFDPEKLDDDVLKKKTSKRYFVCRGQANFVCRNIENHTGNRTWRSGYGWCIIDLKKADIVHRFTQDCLKCDEILDPEDKSKRKKPNFGKKHKVAVEKMAEYAVDVYKHRTSPDSVPSIGGRRRNNKPHLQKLCGICHMLGHHCGK